jgi:hypothetical protein
MARSWGHRAFRAGKRATYDFTILFLILILISYNACRENISCNLSIDFIVYQLCYYVYPLCHYGVRQSYQFDISANC